MRQHVFTRALVTLLGTLAMACSGSTDTGFGSQGGDGGAGGNNGGGGMLPTGDASPTLTGDGGKGGGGGGVTVTAIYANTDDSLYAMDPQTKAVSLIGMFAGLGGGTGDNTVTDCAVNAAGDVYVNTESAVYKAALPAGPGTVQLTRVASIALQSGQRFFALAFAPQGVLGAGEPLVGGDGNGELWSIDPSSGATRDLGNFGADPANPGNILALSGDVVFYSDASGKPTGLATIRSCQAGGGSCDRSSDYLAGIDMAALTAAYSSGTPAASLLAGIYGGSGGNTGSGTGFGDLFGLGAWQGDVFAFERAASQGGSPPQLISVATTSGQGAVVSSAFGFSNGWSGAGVSTKTTVTVPPPPK